MSTLTKISTWPCLGAMAFAFAAHAANPTPQPVIPLNTLEHPVVIDGDLADWGDLLAGGIAMDQHLHQLAGPANPNQSAGAVFKVAHDAEALYLAAHVVDASINTAEPYWTADCLELFLDVRPVGEGDDHFGGKKYTRGVYQLLFSPPSAEKPKARWMAGNIGGGSIGEVQVAGKTVADGYTLEIRIPYASLGIAADRLKEAIGLDVAIDNIDIIDGHRSERAQYAFGRSSSHSNDPSLFSRTQEGAPGVREGGELVEIDPAHFLISPGEWNARPRRTLYGGMLVKTDAMKTDAAPMSVSLRYLGDTISKTPPDNDPVTPAQGITTVNYPGLGVSCMTITGTLDSLKTGSYEVTSKMPDGQVYTTHFQATAWSAEPKPAGQKAESAEAALPNTSNDGQYLLFNGWKLSPAGSSVPLPGNMPSKMVWTPDGKSLLVQMAGFHDQGISIFDPAAKKITRTVPLDKTWPGMCIGPDGKTLYASGGNKGEALAFSLPDVNGVKSIELPNATPGKTWVAGMAGYVGKDKKQMLCVLNESGNSLLIYEGNPLKLQRTLDTGYMPYAVAVSPDGKTIAVSNWGDESVSLFDRETGQQNRIVVGSHPNEMVWSRKGRLFVACSGANSVCVLQGGRVAETIKTCLDPSAPVGSTPIALALSPDEKRLYVANADNNAVAVIAISNPKESKIAGLIPTGWYPSALAVSPDNKTLYVGVGKGMEVGRAELGQYIAKLLNGAIEAIPVPGPEKLGVYTKQVIANTPAPERDMRLTDAQQAILKNTFPKIKHVLWIIRENRTYDQVLGDLPFGNGDPSVAMFGNDVTPNAHALAREFTLMDNLYCSGEVSEDGHEWCNAAYATDFTEKAWMNSYSGRNEPAADERMTESPGGYLWDNCRKHKVSYRSYGEYASFRSDRDNAPVFTGNKGLEGHASEAWSRERKSRDYERVDVFIDELHDAEKSGDWPAYMVMSLGEDHTRGGSVGAFTPNACVASNDLALGKIVEAVSHSRFWENTAIFIMEDDAQDGPDHVDAHRTVGFVISPYTRRHAVDSTLYTTASFIHSMELMLKLPPMTQYDSSATPVFNAMTGTANLAPFDHVDPHISLADKNPAFGPEAAASSKLDFSDYDRCDPATLNAILWHLFKPGTPVPAPVRSVHWLRTSRGPGG